MSDGLRPRRVVVVKIHGACDLACDYCYMYELADPLERERQKPMTKETFLRVAMRLAEYASSQSLPELTVVLHGGEPLLVGELNLGAMAGMLWAAMPPGVKLNLVVQTNGTRLTETMLRVCLKYNVGVGVSVDGDRAAQDRHRLYRGGRSSHDLVTQNIKRLSGRPFSALFHGLLSVIDLANDPIETYRILRAFNPPSIDLLLPHGSWDKPPLRIPPHDGPSSYGDWLICLFDHWYGRPREPRIRLFETLLRLLEGERSLVEYIGPDPDMSLVIAPDGEMEKVDTLRATALGAVSTGLTIFEHGIGDAVGPEWEVPRACQTCRACRLYEVCGGGNHAHRFRASNGFDNPSVFCPDLMHLIDHIQNKRRKMTTDVTER